MSPLAGCRAVLPFPDPVAEGVDVESCRDFVDQDLDGLLDCADPDCDGSCTEEPPRCADGRDNDLDGASDPIDPSCWRERAIAVERCATTEGTDAVLVSGAEFGWTGHADRVDVDGRRWFAATTGEARVGWSTPLSGRVEGTEIELRMFHAGVGYGAVTLAPLSAVSDDLVIAPQAPILRLEMEDDDIRVVSEVLVASFVRGTTVADYFDVRIRLGRSSSIVVRTPEGIETVQEFAGPGSWVEDEPLVLLFEASVADPVVRVGDITLRRPSIEHCGRAVPEMDARGENLLFDVARSPRGLCVIASIDPATVVPRRLRVYESTDGVTFLDRGAVATEGLPLGASIAWDARNTRFAGVIAGQDEAIVVTPTPEWTRAFGGPDCASLAVGASLELPITGLEAQGVDYAVLADGRHRVTFDYLAQTAVRFGLRAYTSLDGAPGTFEVTTLDVGDAYDALRKRGAIPSIDSILDQRLAWLELGGQVFLFRELERGTWVEEESLVLTASSTPGNFDRGRVLAPRLVMEPPPSTATAWAGRLYYSGTAGAPCATCGRIGSADVTVLP